LGRPNNVELSYDCEVSNLLCSSVRPGWMCTAGAAVAEAVDDGTVVAGMTLAKLVLGRWGTARSVAGGRAAGAATSTVAGAAAAGGISWTL
jgi:hypothetical protein